MRHTARSSVAGNGNIPDGFLTLAGNAPLDGTLRYVADKAGTSSAFQLSSTQAALTYTGQTSNTAFNGFLVQNNTAASSGNQQYSPALVLSGKGWKTDATAASQDISYRLLVVPVQGAANPTGYISIQNSTNGAAYATADFQIGNEKNVSFTFNRGSNNHELLTISRVGSPSTPALFFGTGSGPTGTNGRIAANGDSLALGTVSGTTFTAGLTLSTAQLATFAGGIVAASISTVRPATVGTFYQDTAANILANGDKVVGIRV